MLIQFAVENYLSFKEKSVFSMVSAGENQLHPAHVVSEGLGKVPPLVRAAAIYGANAAGKSNLIKAANFAKRLILQGTRGSQSIPVIPFKLGDYSKRPSRFEFFFTHEGVPYSYGFVLNSTQVLEEWLYATPKTKEVRYFERTTLENKEVKVEFGRTFTGKSKEQLQFLEFVAKGTRPNQLFLTEARERNVATVAPVIEWFEKVLLIITAETKQQGLEMMALEIADFIPFLGNYLRSAGTGIEDITLEETTDIDRYFSSELKQELQNDIAELKKGSFLLLESEQGERFNLTRNEEGELTLSLLKMLHRTEEGQLVPFTFGEESDGTLRLIHLLPLLFALKKDTAKVLLIDELDRRMHPMLSRLFVETALDCDKNNERSQLIFTTHETNLLDLALLRRDEIWFVEKDRSGASHLYSLAEFKIRPDLKIEKGYLNGRFGAIPFREPMFIKSSLPCRVPIENPKVTRECYELVCGG